MPTRLIRGWFLEYEPYLSLTTEAQLLHFRILMHADELGCLPLAPSLIRRSCFNKNRSERVIEKLLSQLYEADLLRPYEEKTGKYGFIFRYGQRLQRITLKHPMPPPEVLIGDDEAQAKFAKIQADGSVVNSSPTGPHRSPTVVHLPKGSEVEVKEKEVELKNGKSAQQEVRSFRQWADEFGLKQNPGESVGAFQCRVYAERERRKKKIAGNHEDS